eukprot:scaffold46654_cov64-Phaeocystis_antarctica.AAC.1
MRRQGRSIIRTGGASTCAAAAGPLRDSECFFLRASESLLAWTGLKASEAIRPSSRSHLCMVGKRRLRLRRSSRVGGEHPNL